MLGVCQGLATFCRPQVWSIVPKRSQVLVRLGMPNPQRGAVPFPCAPQPEATRECPLTGCLLPSGQAGQRRAVQRVYRSQAQLTGSRDSFEACLLVDPGPHYEAGLPRPARPEQPGSVSKQADSSQPARLHIRGR